MHQKLLLKTEPLRDDVLKHGDVITLILDTETFQKDVSKLQKRKEFLQEFLFCIVDTFITLFLHPV